MKPGNMERGLGVLAVISLGGPVIGSLMVLIALMAGAAMIDPAGALVAFYLAPFALIVGV